MKRFCFILLAIAAGSLTASAQSGIISNHLALNVKDLNKSVAFYKQVLQLTEIPEPFHDGRHVWLRTGAHSQLHLIQTANLPSVRDSSIHFAYTVKNINQFIKHLDSLHIKYSDLTGTIPSATKRPDGVTQVYFHDPDNFWIEVNNDAF